MGEAELEIYKRQLIIHSRIITYGNADHNLGWGGIHGINVADVNDHRLITQVFQGSIHQVKMNALNQQVGADDRLPAKVVDHCGIIAHT